MNINKFIEPIKNRLHIHSAKTYKDGSTFNVTALDGQGNPAKEVKVQFNINGIVYYRVTDLNGIARLNINLMAGEYIITTIYNGMNTANKITISS